MILRLLLINFLVFSIMLSGCSKAGKVPSEFHNQPSLKIYPFPEISKEQRDRYHEAALRGASWLRDNQIKNWRDAANGQFVAWYPKEKKSSRSFNWMTATGLMAMLMTYHRTGDDSYLKSAELAASYLKSLQILDERSPRTLGYFREDTPQTLWGYPRDALTASWGLLAMYEETKDPENIYRVDAFNKWFFGEGCQYGSIRIVRDRDTLEYYDGRDNHLYPLHWQIMHRYNDDFSGIGLLGAWVLYRDPMYLEKAVDFGDWLIKEQQSDGGFGNPPVASASATAPIFLLDLYRFTGDERYFKAAHRGGAYLLTFQENDLKDPRFYGGFYGEAGSLEMNREFLNLRTSTYAVLALWRLESVEFGPYYSVFSADGQLK